ncbi:DUF1275 domain-containing protein, partial [Streptomyces sp. NPDC059556]
ESAAAGGEDPRPGRRILSVLALVLGALVGALLLDAGLAVALGVALALLVVAAVVTRRLAVTDAAWIRP